jgi:hypothetical protein
VEAVEDRHGGFVFGTICGAVGLVLEQCVLDILWEILTQGVGGDDPHFHGGWGVCYHESMEAFGLGDGVAGTQHAAPGLPEEIVVILDSEVLKEVVQFGEEEGDGPELAISHFLW